jgi:predicted Zn-dependent peptidase
LFADGVTLLSPQLLLLRAMRDHKIHTLSNGIRVVHHRVTTSKIVHCGIMLDVGSRDETLENQGIAHFWEHMAFKGTHKRKAFHIINRLETVGGELNAFTDKEKICFFAALRDEYFERALELLADITFNPVFPKNQLERERKVILEEMSMYFDDPDGALQDEFDALLFPRHSMGMNILGREDTVNNFSRRHFQEFIAKNMDTSRIIFSCVGNVSWKQVVELAEKHLGKVRPRHSRIKRKPFKNFDAREKIIQRPVTQGRCAIGRTAFGIHDNRRGLFYFLNNVLGGPGMNSRLNLALREKHGIVYSVGSQFTPFSDTGIFSVMFGTDPLQMEKAIEMVKREMRKMTEVPMGHRQLSTAKEQFMGQIAMSEENNGGFMMMMARSLLDIGTVPSLDELFNTVKRAKASDVRKLAEEMFDEKKMSTLILEPTKV